MKRDYYEVLGVKKDATEKEIKKAYRRISKENHPDVKPNDKEAEKIFIEANEAYQTLSDKNKRAEYDQFGHEGQRGGMNFNMSDLFRRRRPIKRGQDLRINIKVSLEDILDGVTKKIKYKKLVKCSDCGGLTKTCHECNGSGMTVEVHRMGHHVFQSQATCQSCMGSGQQREDSVLNCKTCNSRGLIHKEVELEVEVPSGVRDGMQLIKEGGGHGTIGGVDGNVMIVITEKKHETFIRSEHDLKINLPLSYTQLVLGDKVTVPTIDGGMVRVTIPPHSKVGHQLRIPQKGLKPLQSPNAYFSGVSRGDMILILNIDIPSNISKEETDLLKKLEEIRNKVES